jgi:hypothetical protein
MDNSIKEVPGQCLPLLFYSLIANYSYYEKGEESFRYPTFSKERAGIEVSTPKQFLRSA